MIRAHNEVEKREFTKIFRVIHSDGKVKRIKEFKSEMQTLAGKKVKFGVITEMSHKQVQKEGEFCGAF